MNQRELLELVRLELTRQANRLENSPHANTTEPTQAVLSGVFDLVRIAKRVRDAMPAEVRSPAKAIEPAPPTTNNRHFADIYGAMQAAAAKA